MFPDFGAYCKSEAAMRSLTHSGAQEWGRYGLTVNTYAPCPVDARMYKLQKLIFEAFFHN